MKKDDIFFAAAVRAGRYHPGILFSIVSAEVVAFSAASVVLSPPAGSHRL